MIDQNLHSKGSVPFAPALLDSQECLPQHHCAAHLSDIEHPEQHARPDAPDCGACPGDGSICTSSCKVLEESPPIDALNQAHQQRIDALEAENDRLRAALADKVSAATMLADISIKNGGMNLSLEGGVCHLLAESFADQFREHGGVNYLEVHLAKRSDGLNLLVTLQNLDGKSPGQLKSEMDLELAEVRKDAARIDAIDHHRIEVIPEYEGGFDACSYQNDGKSYYEPQLRATGKNAREAIDNLLLKIGSGAAMQGQA